MKIEKPDVLGEEQQENVYIPCEGCKLTRDMLSVTCVQCCVEHLMEAQRDDTYQKMLDVFEPLIQRAKAEAAREIFNKIKGAYRHKDQHYMRDGMIDREFRCVSEHSIKEFESKYTEGK